MILLDTRVWIWFVHATPDLSTSERDAIVDDGEPYVAAISVWEVAMLAARGRLTLAVPIANWVQAALTGSGISVLPLTPEVAVEANHLPGTFHKDPADRIIVATARKFGLPLLTRDGKIQAYSQAGHVITT